MSFQNNLGQTTELSKGDFSSDTTRSDQVHYVSVLHKTTPFKPFNPQ